MRSRYKRLSASVCATSVAVAVLCSSAISAQAYTTRAHMYLANEVREALIASGDNSITLLGSGITIYIPEEDAAAIITEPEALRAGAIGPDNMMFPAMTDATHGIGQRPYEQCEILYQAAILATERAYAIGCFLHGAGDAIVHHFVNYLAGETFTLNPISAGRESAWDNVVGHIISEGQIQKAIQDANPDAFSAANLDHVIPWGFVLRTYFNPDSELHQVLGHHAVAAFEQAKAQNPGVPLPQVVANAGFAPVEHMILVPYYLEEFESYRQSFRADLEARLAELQNHGSADGSELQVTAGPDGQLGTWDDETDCALTCPSLYGSYFIHVGLLLERQDAWGDALPAPWDVMSDKLGQDVAELPLALVKTIQLFSTKLNSPLGAPSDDYGVKSPDVNALFVPLDEWMGNIENIDYKTLLYSLAPDVIISLDQLLNNVGFDLAGILQAIVEPLIDEIKQTVKDYIVEQARTYIDDLVTLLEAQKEPIIAEYTSRLETGTDPALGANALEFWNNAGVFVHSFNILAATLANHDVILPFGDDPLGIGPATFDGSFSPEWSQAGLCPHLQEAILPYGLGMQAQLTVELGGTLYPSPMSEDSPIECHDGSLSSFDNPSVATCKHVKLDALVADPAHEGSLSRAYPPVYDATPAECNYVEVPGIPMPLIADDVVGMAGGGDDEPGDDPPGQPAANDNPAAGGTGESPEVGAGCGAADAAGDAWPFALALLAWVVARRRRTVLAALMGLAGVVAGCDGVALDSAGTYEEPVTAEPVASATIATPESLGALPELDLEPGLLPTAPTPPPAPPMPPWPSLVGELGDSVWHGIQVEWEGGMLTTRGYELHFLAEEATWVEVRNPYGPARRRRFRAFQVEDDERTVHAAVIQVNGWPFEPDFDVEETFVFEVIPGNPRTLAIIGDDGRREYQEGAWPQPTGGLTATMRAFGSGPIEDAFCTSAMNGFDYQVIWDFARGISAGPDFGTDTVAPAHLMSWFDPTYNNQFSITNVNGFEILGGTLLSNQYNFTVRYTGTVTHPGGTFSMREEDDSVEDAVWVFLGNDVGGNTVNDLFLEVHGFLWPDETSNEPSTTLAAGDVPIEIIMVRCAEEMGEVRVEGRFGSGAWQRFGNLPTKPDLGPANFPPALDY